MNIASWIPFIQDWFSKTYPSFDIRWINLAFFLLFVTVIYWIIHDLYKHVEELENKKPTISISADYINDRYYLTVTNNGETAVFEAQVAVLRDLKGTIGEMYSGVWMKTDSNTSEILHTHNDSIQIASIRLTKSEQFLDLLGYDRSVHTACIMESIKFERPLNINKMPQFIVQVNISSNPSLREKNCVRTYEITTNGIFPLLLQRKITLIPKPPIKWEEPSNPFQIG